MAGKAPRPQAHGQASRRLRMQRFGVLTGGGDCPGLNPVIRAVTRRAIVAGVAVVGIRNGWEGLIKNHVTLLDLRAVSGILPKGGTILGTSRTNPFNQATDLKRLLANYNALQLNALIVIGGEDTLGVAVRLIQRGLKIIGVPKTIDNDLSNTDYTFGFDTAVTTAMEAIDKLHSTAESHQRVMIIEVMGRYTGWIATCAGLAGGADAILIPEVPVDLDAVCDMLKRHHNRGKDFSIVVVAEHVRFKDKTLQMKLERALRAVRRKKRKSPDPFGHPQLGGIGHVVGELIEQRTGFETRVTVLGHVQRGGSPSAFDRILGTRFGVKAVELALAGQFGKLVSLCGNQVIPVPLDHRAITRKPVDPELYRIAEVFFG